MLETHEQVKTYKECEIYRRRPGFEFTPITLGKIASFIIRGPQLAIAVAAFMYAPTAALEGERVEEAVLLDDAVRTIEQHIDRNGLAPHQDLTFERHDGIWTEVTDPPWWISTFR